MLVNSIGQSTFGAKLFINGRQIKNPPEFIKNYEKLANVEGDQEGTFSVSTHYYRDKWTNERKPIHTLCYNGQLYHDYFHVDYKTMLRMMEKRIKEGRSLNYPTMDIGGEA